MNTNNSIEEKPAVAADLPTVEQVLDIIRRERAKADAAVQEHCGDAEYCEDCRIFASSAEYADHLIEIISKELALPAAKA